MSPTKPFWETKSLAEMTSDEWESLCDGCGKCCLVLLEDEDDGSVWETDVACRLFDPKNRRCTDYNNRFARVPDCVRLNPDNAGDLPWMPATCAYRLLAQGEPLPEWHPLITGDPASTVRAGMAVAKNLVREHEISAEEVAERASIERLPPRKNK